MRLGGLVCVMELDGLVAARSGMSFSFFFQFSLLEMYLVEVFQWDGRVDARDAREWVVMLAFSRSDLWGGRWDALQRSGGMELW